MPSLFTAPGYPNLQTMSNRELNYAISICRSNKMLGVENLNALYEESWARGGFQNPSWNTPEMVLQLFGG